MPLITSQKLEELNLPEAEREGRPVSTLAFKTSLDIYHNLDLCQFKSHIKN